MEVLDGLRVTGGRHQEGKVRAVPRELGQVALKGGLTHGGQGLVVQRLVAQQHRGAPGLLGQGFEGGGVQRQLGVLGFHQQAVALLRGLRHRRHRQTDGLFSGLGAVQGHKVILDVAHTVGKPRRGDQIVVLIGVLVAAAGGLGNGFGDRFGGGDSLCSFLNYIGSFLNIGNRQRSCSAGVFHGNVNCSSVKGHARSHIWKCVQRNLFQVLFVIRRNGKLIVPLFVNKLGIGVVDNNVLAFVLSSYCNLLLTCIQKGSGFFITIYHIGITEAAVCKEADTPSFIHQSSF